MRIAGRAGLIPTCLMMLPGIAYLGCCCCSRPLIELLTYSFCREVSYYNSTRCSVFVFVFVFFLFMLISIYILPVHWLCNKEDKKAFLAFRICLFIMYLVPLLLLTFCLQCLILYAFDKGITPKCFYGFVFVISEYAVITLAFISWKIFRYLLMLLLLLFSGLCLYFYINEPLHAGPIILIPGSVSTIVFCVLICNIFRKNKKDLNNGSVKNDMKKEMTEK